ncbi:hypothetical protein [Acidicapsa acidisoli]|uniref:hypothetical protein n=1 Tax=Acidicapsa acidisoli TaxID=1615681 RepID=UPI0021DF7DF7|nr:hypothetical protein [Acidicapsa acidisoli]
MVQRTRDEKDKLNVDLLTDVLKRFDEIEAETRTATFTDASDACTTYPIPTGTAIKTPIVIGMAILLG